MEPKAPLCCDSEPVRLAAVDVKEAVSVGGVHCLMDQKSGLRVDLDRLQEILDNAGVDAELAFGWTQDSEAQIAGALVPHLRAPLARIEQARDKAWLVLILAGFGWVVALLNTGLLAVALVRLEGR